MKREIEKIAGTVVYRNRWMTVREDKILRADGSSGIYGVVEKPDFAVIAAVNADGLHLVEQFRYPVDGRFWELPQGSWEGQDADPITLAKAELREETGLVASHMVHVGRLSLAYAFCTQGFNLFFATDLEQRAPEREFEEQGLVAKPFPIPEVEIMLRQGIITDATTVAAFGLLRLKGLI